MKICIDLSFFLVFSRKIWVTLIRATIELLIDRAELIRSLDRYIDFEDDLHLRPVGSFWGLRVFF